MTTPPKTEFTPDFETGVLRISREFRANRQIVWDCYTKCHLLDQWYSPETLTTMTRSFDFREGGHWHFAMVDRKGNHYWSRTDYETISPVDGYSARESFTDETGIPNPDMPQANLTVQFLDQGEKTVMKINVTYCSPDDLRDVMDMGKREGFLSTLDKLDKLLAGHES